MKKVLAFDFGASSGRAILGSFDGESIKLEEVHRFANEPVSLGGTVYWDALRLFHEIKQGILKAKLRGNIESIGIDTWGVDFALLDFEGKLIENPVHYRDLRNEGMIKESEKYISNRDLYDITGIQLMEFNTCFQLLSLLKHRPHIIERADKLLLMPDFFNYLLTGQMKTEYSIATTSQMIDINKNDWSTTVLDKLNIPASLFTDLIKPASLVGKLSEDLCKELNIDPLDVVAVCGHDTQSAVSAVPSTDEDFVFISSGTWSLFGTELNEPIVNDASFELNITNEGGYDYRTAFLKNICGLWLIQESRRQWQREGQDFSYAKLEELALGARPFTAFIDPDAPEFVAMGDMPERVRKFCKDTGQYVPCTMGEVVRCIYESLAMKYRYTLENISDCTGKSYDKIHIVGGGTKDNFLCQLTANATNLDVIAGPVEATVLGNIALQLIYLGQIESVDHARRIIQKTEKLETYKPQDPVAWDKAYGDFLKVIKKSK